MVMRACYHIHRSIFQPLKLVSGHSRRLVDTLTHPSAIRINQRQSTSLAAIQLEETHVRTRSNGDRQEKKRQPDRLVSSHKVVKKYDPIPILKKHSTNIGYVTRILARDPKQIAKLELKRWLKRQVFEAAHLDSFVKAVQQPDWPSAIAVLEQAYGAHQSWMSQVPSSLLAELATKPVKIQDELDDLLTLIGYRIAEEDDVLITSQLLNGALQASLSFGNLVISAELVSYAIRFSTEIARVEIEKQSSFSASPSLPNLPTRTFNPPDPTLALKPLLAAIAGLMSTQTTALTSHRFRFLAQLLKAMINLCGGLDSVFNRLSKPNIHLVCRSMIISILSPDGYSIKPDELDAILKQGMPAPTLRLAMLAMIRIGARGRATEIERLLRKTKTDQKMDDYKLELDLAFHEVRRCKLRAYSGSQKLHQRFLSHLPADASLETYTAYMSTLFRHHLPKMALQVWEQMIGKGMIPDPAALQVAMSIYIDLGRPLEAVKAFNQFISHHPKSKESSISKSCHQPDCSPVSKLQILTTYARALDLAGRYSQVYELWKSLETEWGLEPESRMFGALMSSARKLARRRMSRLSTNMVRRIDSDGCNLEVMDEDYWDGRRAGDVAIELFWTILYENWPAMSETVRPLRLSESIWSHTGGILKNPVGRGGLQMLIQPLPSRAIKTGDKTRISIARSIMPSLKVTTRWSKIIPNRSSFKDMIELLGFNDQADLIPSVLSWMRIIDVKPNQEILTGAYYWVYRSSCITHRLTRLDRFVEEWIDEIGENPTLLIGLDEDDENRLVDPVSDEDLDRLKEVNDEDRSQLGCQTLMVPTEEMIQVHHLHRVKWSDRIYFSKSQV